VTQRRFPLRTPPGLAQVFPDSRQAPVGGEPAAPWDWQTVALATAHGKAAVPLLGTEPARQAPAEPAHVAVAALWDRRLPVAAAAAPGEDAAPLLCTRPVPQAPPVPARPAELSMAPGAARAAAPAQMASGVQRQRLSHTVSPIPCGSVASLLGLELLQAIGFEGCRAECEAAAGEAPESYGATDAEAFTSVDQELGEQKKVWQGRPSVLGIPMGPQQSCDPDEEALASVYEERGEQKKEWRGKPRPCKGKRYRYRRLVEKLRDSIELDPESFQLNTMELPPSVGLNPRLLGKLMNRITKIREEVVANIATGGAAPAASVCETESALDGP